MACSSTLNGVDINGADCDNISIDKMPGSLHDVLNEDGNSILWDDKYLDWWVQRIITEDEYMHCAKKNEEHKAEYEGPAIMINKYRSPIAPEMKVFEGDLPFSDQDDFKRC